MKKPFYYFTNEYEITNVPTETHYVLVTSRGDIEQVKSLMEQDKTKEINEMEDLSARLGLLKELDRDEFENLLPLNLISKEHQLYYWNKGEEKWYTEDWKPAITFFKAIVEDSEEN